MKLCDDAFLYYVFSPFVDLLLLLRIHHVVKKSQQKLGLFLANENFYMHEKLIKNSEILAFHFLNQTIT